jgi:glutaryl-CoA dehydrogenase
MTTLHETLLGASGDFYGIAQTLSDDDQALLAQLRAFLDAEVAPIMNDYWQREAFPYHIIPQLGRLGIAGLPLHGYGCPGKGALLDGLVAMELARCDPSVATFWAVTTGLIMWSIYLCGDEQQKQRWLPPLARMELVGAFGLTEPEVGSGAARGLQTTARRDGAGWRLNGQKAWIGNATHADLTVIWARDEADHQVKGFLVEQGTPGFLPEKMTGKLALRSVQNARITLSDCFVPEANRLQRARSFKDTASVLRMTRATVGWLAAGCARGAYDHALRYAGERQQFGRPIAGFQLIQDHLVRMLGNITASQTMLARLAQIQDEGTATDEQASLAKAFCTARMRETVAHARELMGGNGVLFDNHVARFFADAEAIYSYEGTYEINTLIVGRAITGLGAFV